MELIQKILKERNVFFHENEGITIATVESLHDGFALAKEILYQIVDPRTVLYLSGGSTPKVLYERFASEEKLIPGAVGVVDERYGPKFHDNSNEKMFRETGLLRYLEMRNIPFYPILNSHPGEATTSFQNDRKQTAEAYDEQLRSLNATYQKSVAILGIGTDGHTAGLPALNSKVEIQNAKFFDEKYDLVTQYHDTIGPYGQRVTMTFTALSMLDVLLVLAFGEEKKKALELAFTDGSESEIPARFFKRSEIAKKTLFITDQRV
jgi:6-phosphogluconolactonase/glucosamine-6-phosphate isomerase/deaminase